MFLFDYRVHTSTLLYIPINENNSLNPFARVLKKKKKARDGTLMEMELLEILHEGCAV